jgi:hypothetical protein
VLWPERQRQSPDFTTFSERSPETAGFGTLVGFTVLA